MESEASVKRKREFEDAMQGGGEVKRRRTGLSVWEVVQKGDHMQDTIEELTINAGGHDAYEGMVEELTDDGVWVVDTKLSLSIVTT